MGIFLVLRNNTRRNFRKRSTYVLFVAIPLMVLLFGMVSENIKQKSYVIGVISEQSLEWGAVPEGIRVVSIKPEHANTEVIMGNLLSTFIVVFCQVAMVLVVLWMVYGENVISGRSAALLALCISLVSAMVGGIVATLAKSELGANVSVTIFAVLCSVFGGTFLAVEQMPGILGMIGKCSPIYWMICLLG